MEQNDKNNPWVSTSTARTNQQETGKKVFEMELEPVKMGRFLREVREKNNISQKEMAERMNRTHTYISRLENGWHDIQLVTLHRLVKEGFKGKIKIRIEI